MSNENQNWLHDLFINEAKAAKDYHNRGGGEGGGEAIPTQEKTVDITQNGVVVVEPDEGHTMSKVTANVNIESEAVECSGKHVIEVDELPTENIDTAVLYKCGDSYYQYVEGAFRDLIQVSNGEASSIVELYTQYLGVTVDLYQIKTKPTTEEELAEIVVTDVENGTTMAIYYIEDEADAAIYDGSAWNALGATGVIADVSEATEDGMYILAGSYWNTFEKPGIRVIRVAELPAEDIDTNAVYFCDGKYCVYTGSEWIEYLFPTGELEITENGTYDVTNLTSAIVDIPTSYMSPRAVEELPADAPVGSTALVFGGE